MSDMVREKQIAPTMQSNNSLFMDAYKEFAAGIAHLDGRTRQATVAAYGAVVGGIKDIPNEFMNHPLETAGKVAIAGVTGTALAAAAAAESPLVVSGALLGASAASALSLWDSYNRLASNEKLKHAMDAVYKSGDPSTIASSLKVASDVIGPEAFNYGLVMASMCGGGRGPKAWSNFCDRRAETMLLPFVPMAEVTPFRATELRFSHCSSLHIHGKEAIFRIGGDEWQLNVYEPQGADLGMRGSYLGRQVFKGGLGLNGFLKVDINPDINTTKVVWGNRLSGYKHSEYKHSDLQNRELRTYPVLCEECRPFRQAMREARRQSGD